MDLRLPVAVALAGLVTFGLFWLMQALIGVSGELREGKPPTKVDFVRLRRDTTPETKEREKPQREVPQQQPPPPEMNLAESLHPSEGVGEIAAMIDTGAELEKATSLAAGGGGGSDRDIVPLVRVDPEYPPRAKQQGIEGWVDIEFTISPAGTVQDERVLEAQPPAIFDRAALNAVRRWRYNPRVENGVPVARPGVQVRIRFDMGARRR
jgi:protein TonB